MKSLAPFESKAVFPLPMNRSDCRQVLDCAGPLALSDCAGLEKRQRAAALPDAVAPASARFVSRPLWTIREVLKRSMNLTLVGTSRGDVPARIIAGGTVAPLNVARTAQRAVPNGFRGSRRNLFRRILFLGDRAGVRRKLAFILTGIMFCLPAFSYGAETNSFSPTTARDFYNAGTRLLDEKKFTDAERMFQSALATQNERIQPAALYNLGHARFDDGVELLKKGPDAQKAAARGNLVSTEGGQAIRFAQSALDENELSKMIAAYVEGRGARRDIRDVEKAIRSAMETYGSILRLWRRAADDFKSAAELNPADTNATHNAEIVEQYIAKLVDRLQKMQQMSGALAGQHQQINDLLNQLRGRIPKEDMPPGAPGDDDEEDVQPGSLAGQKEGASREGNQMQAPLSPDEASQILDGLSLDGSRRLPMSDQQTKTPNDANGRNW